MLNSTAILFSKPKLWVEYRDVVTNYRVKGLTASNVYDKLKEEYPRLEMSMVTKILTQLKTGQIIYIAYNRTKGLEPVYRPLRYMD